MVRKKFDQFKHTLLLENSAQTWKQLIQKSFNFCTDRFINNTKILLWKKRSFYLSSYLLVNFVRIDRSKLFYALHRCNHQNFLMKMNIAILSSFGAPGPGLCGGPLKLVANRKLLWCPLIWLKNFYFLCCLQFQI